MRRFRLSTLMLLIVIAALGFGMVVRERRAARREAELQARLAQSWPLFVENQKIQKIAEDWEQTLLKFEELRRRLATAQEQSKRSSEDTQR